MLPPDIYMSFPFYFSEELQRELGNFSDFFFLLNFLDFFLPFLFSSHHLYSSLLFLIVDFKLNYLSSIWLPEHFSSWISFWSSSSPSLHPICFLCYIFVGFFCLEDSCYIFIIRSWDERDNVKRTLVVSTENFL